MAEKNKLLEESFAPFDIVPDERASERFEIYSDFLREYNKKVNLTAITDPEEIIVKHFSDSAAVLKYINIPQNAAVADVGTGAGFPGIVLLILRNDIKLTLIEATNKKLEFIFQLLEKLELTAKTVHLRGEEAGTDARYREKYDIVTARAVAALPALSEYCIPLLKVGGMFCALKGSGGAEECYLADNAIKKLGGNPPAVHSYDLINGDARTIILSKKISRTPPNFPRASTLIVKKPIE